MQVTSSALFSELSCWATSGPTYDQQPVFQWSTSGFKPTPLGHPDKWAFSPVLVKLTFTVTSRKTKALTTPPSVSAQLSYERCSKMYYFLKLMK